MGLFKKLFGDDGEKEREDEAKRKAAEDYAEQHNRSEHAAAKTATATKKAEPKAEAKPAVKGEKAEKAEKPASAKAAEAKKPTEKPAEKKAEPKAAEKKSQSKAASKPEIEAAPKTEAKTAEKSAPAAAAAKSAAAIPSQRTYAPAAGAPAAGTHTHVHAETDGPVTAEHEQMMTIHVETHVPDHAPRTDDPHYHLFEQAKSRLKRQGLWKCIIADELCDGEPELHHSYIEFSQINEMDPKKIQEALGLHFDNDEEFQEWVESPQNLEVLCAGHHRLHYGIHVIPGPLWEAVRFRLAGTQAAAEFVTADEVKEEQKKEAAAKAES